MNTETNNDKFFRRLVSKSALKKQVYQNTLEVFQEMKLVGELIRFELEKRLLEQKQKVKIDFRDKGLFEAELHFSGDTLLFSMHSNVFEFPRMHEVMKTSYVKEDPDRSYCGVIHIYNFLTDSFHFNRLNDMGYLVARLFVNKENHFLVEGKHQTSFYFNQFMNQPITQDDLRTIMESAMLYSLEFDLLTPPYDLVKQVTVGEVQENAAARQLKTGKRLGFKFQADHDQQKS